MLSPVYLMSTVASVCAFYFIWTFGIRTLLLDAMRERLFALRFEMFRLGMGGELSFDDEAYRSLETLFNGQLRFGHRMTFLTWVFSAMEIDRAKREDKDYVSVGSQIMLKVSRLRPETQEKLAKIMYEAYRATLKYVAFSSLLFLSTSAVLITLESLGLVNLDEKKQNAREVIETEAYAAGSKVRGMQLASA